jgi:hypothetical protein
MKDTEGENIGPDETNDIKETKVAQAEQDYHEDSLSH